MKLSANSKRIAIILLVHGLVWALALIIADNIWGTTAWGEDLVLWMAVVFAVANGILVKYLFVRARSDE